jgi:hypothetical protein
MELYLKKEITAINSIFLKKLLVIIRFFVQREIGERLGFDKPQLRNLHGCAYDEQSFWAQMAMKPYVCLKQTSVFVQNLNKNVIIKRKYGRRPKP